MGFSQHAWKAGQDSRRQGMPPATAAGKLENICCKQLKCGLSDYEVCSMITLYGIPNCDTVKKARAFLEKSGVPYRFHDYKKDGIDLAVLKRCCSDFGYESVLNQRGTTWRKLDEAQRSNLTQAKALELMESQPSVIKRPIVDTGKTLLLGFDEAAYRGLSQNK